jgi:heme A synthase
MDLRQIHGFLSITVSLYVAFVTLWLLWKYLRDQALDGNFWGVIWTGEILLGIQALLGVIQLVQGRMPRELIHLLYGFLTPLIWPATFSFTREQPEKRQVMIWFLVSAFLFGISLRARGTALP